MVETSRVTLGPATVLIYQHPDQTSGTVDADYVAKNIVLINVSATQETVYIGGSNAMSVADGARWTPDAGRTLSMILEPGEAIYAALDDVAGLSQDIDILVNGR